MCWSGAWTRPATLLDLGLHRATDVVGGYEALAAAGVLEELTPGR